MAWQSPHTMQQSGGPHSNRINNNTLFTNNFRYSTMEHMYPRSKPRYETILSSNSNSDSDDKSSIRSNTSNHFIKERKEITPRMKESLSATKDNNIINDEPINKLNDTTKIMD